MRYQQALAIALVAGVFNAGCKKEPANEAPRVSIITPSEFASVTLPDTVLVEVEASDDQGLAQISVTLLDANGIPVAAGASAAVSGTSASRTLALPITSEQLNSGVYQLLAVASDGSLTGRDSRQLQVTAIPLRVRSVFTLVEQGANSLALYRTDSLGQTTVAATWPMDLGGAAISSAAQRLVVAGAVTGDLRAMHPDDLATAWLLPNLGSIGAPWFTSVDLCADGRLYAGQDNGTLRAFTASNGVGGTTITLPDLFRTQQAITVEDRVVATERHFVTQEQLLGIYYRQSGVAIASQPLAVQPIGLFMRDADHVLIFGNSGAQGRVLDRTLSSGGTWEAYTWGSTIAAVTRLSDGEWLVALASGELARYAYGGGSISVGTAPLLHAMAYEALDGLVYGCADGQVLLINPLTGATMPGWSVSGSARCVLPLYNR
ncbi:MAG: hypothetical protein IT230_11755 [Flavobacteriales bacterium]|nr:hypothetical protein [Flavobacteriales bacterium]